jgi:hypothetical protein
MVTWINLRVIQMKLLQTTQDFKFDADVCW